MILEKPFLLFVFPALCLALGLAIASFNVSPTPYVPVDFDLNELAQLTQAEGRVEISRYHTSHSSPLPQGKKLEISLYNLDTIQTRLASKTRVHFLDGYELEFSPKSLFIVEQWNPEENTGPIYMNVLAGDYKVIKKGRPGSLYIVRNGQIFDPSRKPKKNRRTLSLVIRAQVEHQALNTEKPTPSPSPAEKPAPQQTALIQTLTNEYIDETIAKNRDQFVKCQQYAVRENKASKGQILVGISIEPIGKMKDVRVLASDIDNPELHDCVSKVLNRTNFRSFTGSEIVRSYPLIFE